MHSQKSNISLWSKSKGDVGVGCNVGALRFECTFDCEDEEEDEESSSESISEIAAM